MYNRPHTGRSARGNPPLQRNRKNRNYGTKTELQALDVIYVYIYTYMYIGKGKVDPLLKAFRHEAVWEIGHTDPRILDLGTSW
jgi:hypothetical protein